MAGTRSISILLGFWWRRAATGLCFLIFMVSGLFLAFLVLPLIRILPLTAQKRAELSLGLVNLSFHIFTRIMISLRAMRSFKVLGREHLRPGSSCLYIANHPTLIDVVTIMGSLLFCNCIVKETLFRNRFMGGVLRQAGLIANDSGLLLMALIQKEIEAGHPLLVFPEGTRSPEGGLNPFSRGAAQIAARTGLPVAPVLVSCKPITLMKGSKWYDVPERGVDFTLEFFPPFQFPPEINQEPAMPLKVRRMNRFFEQFFKEKLGLDAPKNGCEGPPSLPH